LSNKTGSKEKLSVSGRNSILPFPYLLQGFPKSSLYVITGGPGSGKSTLIEVIRELGLASTIPEIARILIENEKKWGRGDPRGNFKEFEKQVLELQLQYEEWFRYRVRETDIKPRVFCDRGLPDIIAYHRWFGEEVDKELFQRILQNPYENPVFILERVDPETYKNDGVRVENYENSKILERYIEEVYRELGYETIRVPFKPISERIKFIWEVLGWNTKELEERLKSLKL